MFCQSCAGLIITISLASCSTNVAVGDEYEVIAREVVKALDEIYGLNAPMAGIWDDDESKGCFAISQRRNDVKSVFAYQSPQHGYIRGTMNGRVDDAGNLSADFTHTHKPAGWQNQRRVGTLTKNQRSFVGTASWDGGRHDFTLTLQHKSQRLNPRWKETDTKFPDISGLWRESKNVTYDVSQTNGTFTAKTEYTDESSQVVRATINGQITVEGLLTGSLVHQSPKKYTDQIRVGFVANDGQTIQLRSSFDNGVRANLLWVRNPNDLEERGSPKLP